MNRILIIAATAFVLSACCLVRPGADLRALSGNAAASIDARELSEARESLSRLLDAGERGIDVLNQYLGEHPNYVAAFGELIEEIGTEKWEKGAPWHSLQEVLRESNLLLYIERKLPTASATAREHYFYLLREIDREALPLLRNIAAHPTPELRAGAIYSLAVLEDSHSVELMKEALADKRSRDIQIHAAFALSCFGDSSGKDLILARLKEAAESDWDFEPPDIYLCVQAAENLRLARAVPQLIEMMKKEAPSTSGSSAIADALRGITSRDFGEDHDKWSKWYSENKDK
jgi:hypothetical protein